MAALQRSDQNPIEFLKNECNLEGWNWIDEFQSKRSLALLGMSKNANWIKCTAMRECPKINTFIHTKIENEIEEECNDIDIDQSNKENTFRHN